MQEALLKTFRHAQRIREPEAFRPWLYRTVRNACLMRRRRRVDEPAHLQSLDELMPTPDGMMALDPPDPGRSPEDVVVNNRLKTPVAPGVPGAARARSAWSCSCARWKASRRARWPRCSHLGGEREDAAAPRAPVPAARARGGLAMTRQRLPHAAPFGHAGRSCRDLVEASPTTSAASSRPARCRGSSRIWRSCPCCDRFAGSLRKAIAVCKAAGQTRLPAPVQRRARKRITALLDAMAAPASARAKRPRATGVR